MGIESFNFSELLPFIGVGFAAQLVDGALGMAFGVISNTLMVGVLGMPLPRALMALTPRAALRSCR